MRRMHPAHESHLGLAVLLPAAALLAMGLAACGDAPTAAAEPREPGELNFVVIAAASDFVVCGGEVPITVTVTDDLEDPVPGVLVNFHATAGGGSFWAGSGITNADGVVRDYWTVGTVPNGTNTFEARTVDAETGDKLVHFTQTVWTATRIVFASTRDGNWEIYSMLPDGSDQRRLTNHAAADINPAWSPTAERIVFATNRDGNYEIYTMAADGTDLQRLTNNTADDITPSWSPNGQKLAFASFRDNRYEIYRMNPNGTTQERFTISDAADLNPVFSPDGAKNAFATMQDGNWEIYTLFPFVRLTNNAAEDHYPDWSSSGVIAFSSNRDGNREIYSMAGNGTGQTRLTNDPADDRSPTWAPDNTRIAFSRNQLDLYSINADGTDPQQLTTELGQDVTPRWSRSCAD